MKILVVCKRQYSDKDLLEDRFGRLYELPRELARQGHSVRVCALSYRRRPEDATPKPDDLGVQWHSINALPQGLLRHFQWLDTATSRWRPDVVWASSDMLQAVLAAKWAIKRDVPYVIDLYDNYESFGLSRLPGLSGAFRSACRRAYALTAVSHALAEYVRGNYRVAGPVHVVVNGVNTEIFHPLDKHSSRTALGLPVDARLIGTAGALTSSRGISDLFDAFIQLAQGMQDLWLVHAGPTDRTVRRYRHPRIIDLGRLPQTEVPRVLASLDVGVVCNRSSAFGRYCFPLKLHEMLAMRVPLVATALGDVAQVLDNHAPCLYEPGNVEMLADRISMQLAHPSIRAIRIPTWRNCAIMLDSALRATTAGASTQM
ncbi:glycosyltransferase family 4 protein [Xanthomonas sp. WHRI 7945]|nr:glycosyltransferase family 4 protein [Xanthomonas campestris pv. campestris]